MNEPPFDRPKAHRWFAVQLNNRAWDLLESAGRSDAESGEMVHTAHASVFHWLQVGTGANHCRALCLLGNVYAALGRGEEAARYAGQCLALTNSGLEGLADWDFAFAYDCLARATAAKGDVAEAGELKRKARAAGDRIADAEDKQFFDQWFAGGEWHGVE